MLANLVLRLDQRYPTASEKAAVADYLESFPDRLAAYEEMRAKQKEMIEDVMSEYSQLYPRFKQYHPQGWEKTQRDMEMDVTFVATSMLMDDKAWMDNVLLFWFSTILKSVHLSPQFMQDAFRLWDKQMRQHLTPRAYDLCKPYFDHMANRLCSIPEPHRAEVGERRTQSSRVPVAVG